MKSKKLFFLFLFTITVLPVLDAQQGDKEAVTTGPASGTLIIVGGGEAQELIKYFIEVAGGKDAPIVIIPTAGGADSYDENSSGAIFFKNQGATNITVLHTNDRDVANSEAFVKPLLKAKGVWFSGGRQWHLVDSYKNTLTEKMLWKVLERNGVIGGSSAGATIQGSFLARGDTRNNQIMMGDHQEGFGFIKNVAIDQHVLARNRQFDMFDILRKRPELLGLGIDEGTAIIVRGNQFEVIGKSYVIVYDGTFCSSEGSDLKTLPNKTNLFYFLRRGDKYDLLNRRIIQ
jgi:cyanophycinase